MQKKTIVLGIILIIGAVVLVFGGQVVNAQSGEPAAASVNQLIIKYKPSANLTEAAQAQVDNQMQRLSAAAGMNLTYFRPMSGEAHVLRLPEKLSVNQALEITEKLSALPEVEYAEPDYLMFPLGETTESPLVEPGDPLYASQWHYFAPVAGSYGVNAPAAWDITTGSSSVYVAVLDTGILNHTDLSNRWQGGYDMISDALTANDGGGRDSDPHDPGDWITSAESNESGGYFENCTVTDSSWHGTHVAGTIGAATNNTLGVAGLNWVSKIIPVRVLGKCGGYTSDIADGINWAAGISVPGVPDNPNPVQVINMSLGGGGACATTTQSAIDAAVGAGTTVVVAAGNSNADAGNFSPASCNDVVTVSSTDRYGDRAYYSNYGSVVEISAPGGDTRFANSGVLSTLDSGLQGPAADNSYEYYQGTSMAAPHVAGVASLLYSVNPALTPAQVLSTLQNTATAFPGGSSCNTSICGSGIVNAGAAVASISNVPPAAPVIASISNPGGDGDYLVDWNDVANADSYTLQEDDNSGFTSPTTVYTSTVSQYSVTGQVDDTWYYRVLATNTYGDSSWSNTASVYVGDERYIYLPLVLKNVGVPSGPTPGFWEGLAEEFYVTPDGGSVDRFAIYISVDGCGNYKITHISPVPAIVSDQFSFSGDFYFSGTFNTPTSASGIEGLSYFDLYGCGIVSGGPWAWSADWVNSSQPTVLSAELVAPNLVESLPSFPNAYEVIKLEP